jgi:hypothetical protein
MDVYATNPNEEAYQKTQNKSFAMKSKLFKQELKTNARHVKNLLAFALIYTMS